MTTYWLIETLPDNYTQFLYRPYLHLNTANGTTLVNSTARGIKGYYYRRGALYIQPIAVPIPGDARPGQYQLELGLYDGVHQAGTTFFPANEAPRRFYTTTVDLEPWDVLVKVPGYRDWQLQVVIKQPGRLGGPVRLQATNQVIAVTEFYQRVNELEGEIAAARQQ